MAMNVRVEAIPAVLYTVMVLQIPNSPRWLAINRQDDQGALKTLRILYDEQLALAKLKEIKERITIGKVKENLFSGKYKTPLIRAFLIAFFNQLSGINFVLYYAPEILERAGLAAQESLFSSIAIGIVNLIFTFVGVWLIDRLGRKQLMKIGSIGYIVSLGMVGWCFYSGASSAMLLTFVLIFIASHAVGQGAVIWVFIPEIFPQRVRAWGQSWGTGAHWVFAAIITLVTPMFLDSDNGVFKDNPWPNFYILCRYDGFTIALCAFL